MCDDPLFFIGPDGKQVSVAQLPPGGLYTVSLITTIVVATVRHGLISLDEALRQSIDRQIPMLVPVLCTDTARRRLNASRRWSLFWVLS